MSPQGPGPGAGPGTVAVAHPANEDNADSEDMTSRNGHRSPVLPRQRLAEILSRGTYSRSA